MAKDNNLEVINKLNALREQWKTATIKEKNMIEDKASILTCGNRINGKRCGKPVRYEESFVCEDHIVNYKDGKSKKTWTIQQMQDRLKEWSKESNV